jgi:hypothetical protein
MLNSEVAWLNRTYAAYIPTLEISLFPSPSRPRNSQSFCRLRAADSVVATSPELRFLKL